MASPPRSECVDDERLEAFISGLLTGSALSSVESHLAGCAACREVVADAARGALEGEQRPPSSVEPAVELGPGAIVAGKYVIEGFLGRGGMGAVFLARHIELGHRVAIKVLHSTDATAAARFLLEAKASAQLASEHIVRVHDLGRLPGGGPYLVMEYLLGEDLARVVARGPVPIGTAVDYLLQICAALREAHAAGIIHRDLKPGNVFVTRRSDGQERLKVLDFGVSKFVSRGELALTPSLTLPQSILGSPLYMSPEQIRASKDVGEATDLWSVGVISYELLTGQRPFVAPTLSALSVAIATESPKPPSSHVSGIPAELEAVVLRCLEKDPANRFPSFAALESALVALGDLRSEPRRPSQLAPRLFSERPRWLWAGVLAAALVAVGGAWAKRRAADAAGATPSPEQTATVTHLEREVPASLPMPPELVIRCDRPVPLGNLTLWTATEPGAETVPWQRAIPMNWLCEATTTDGRRQELLATIREAPGAIQARLEIPNPFYSVEIQQTPGRVEITGSRQARAPIALVLGGHCRAIRSVGIGADGIAMVRAEPAPGGATDLCRRTVTLPAEAWGQRLQFDFEPAEFVADRLLWASESIRLEVREKTAARRTPRDPTPRCAPPDYLHCRD